jgi:hypothetical protein
LSNTNFEAPQTAPAHNGAYVKMVNTPFESKNE